MRFKTSDGYILYRFECEGVISWADTQIITKIDLAFDGDMSHPQYWPLDSWGERLVGEMLPDD